ncbi:MAG: hypothetical protein ACYC27_20215 [Armatimonadota bacterium]
MIYIRFILVLLISIILLGGCTRSAIESPVNNGDIVLVKKGNIYGAFIPGNQEMEPETLDYDWYYRTDGKGTFRSSESSEFKHGNGKGAPIKFGAFTIGWSGNMKGKGFIYYKHENGGRVSPDDIRICVTGETDIEKIDAADGRWLYRASTTDRGVKGNR